MIEFQRKAMIDFLNSVERHLISLPDDSYTDSDYQLDRLYRDWKGLPGQRRADTPYMHLDVSKPELAGQWNRKAIKPDLSKPAHSDFAAIASKINVPVAVLKAVCEVESNGTAFNADGSLKCLFEGHLFWYHLIQYEIDVHAIQALHPTLCFPRWLAPRSNHYLGGIREYERVDRAVQIHREAALMSASWGSAQILGMHWRSLGYASIEDFLIKLSSSELGSLDALARFLLHNGLTEAMRSLDWHGIARGYNGESYAANDYHNKLARAYAKYA